MPLDTTAEAVGMARPEGGRSSRPQFANGPLANWGALPRRDFGGS
jgi:hypothetical protein